MKVSLPEEKRVQVSLLSFNDGERFTSTVKGRLRPAGEGFQIRYKEQQMDGIETALTFDGARLTLSRSDGTRLTFEKDGTTAGVYCLPYGKFEAEVKTAALSCRRSPQKTEISLCYALRMGGQDFSCKMKISATEEVEE